MIAIIIDATQRQKLTGGAISFKLRCTTQVTKPATAAGFSDWFGALWFAVTVAPGPKQLIETTD